MTEIILHGILAKKFRPKYSFDSIKKVEDCIYAVDCISSGFKKFIIEESTRGINYEFIIDGNKIKTEKDFFKIKNFNNIEIVPSVGGADPVTFFVTLAINLIVAGITYLMTPVPEFNLGPEPSLQAGDQIYLFSTSENTAQQGVSVPVCYGTLRAGSKIIQTSTKSIQNASSDRTSFLIHPDSPQQYLNEEDIPIHQDVIDGKVGPTYFEAVFGRNRVIYDKIYKGKNYGQNRGSLNQNVDNQTFFLDDEGNVQVATSTNPIASESDISVAIHHDGI
tara:strand:+ start:1722 stop:2552 length:831 start_codon:yes stop_codon:yes gene_type:complete